MNKFYVSLWGEHDNSDVELSGDHVFTHYTEIEQLLKDNPMISGFVVTHALVITFDHGEIDVEKIENG